jgi:hypothetical protein
MKMFWNLIFAPLLLSFAFGTLCRADILTFDSPPVSFQQGYGPGQAYIEDDFSFTTTNTPGFSGSIIRFNPATQIYPCPNDGTIYFGDTYYSHPMMTTTNGALFDISQIDIDYYSSSVMVSNITFLGIKADGSTVTTTFDLSGPFTPQFQTFQFDSDWTDLTSVDFLTQGFAWDNIYASVVPEPDSIAVFAIGVALAICARFRKGPSATPRSWNIR